MAKASHNLTIKSIAYADSQISNNPRIRAWDYHYELLGGAIANPRSDFFEIASGETLSIFNNIRTTGIGASTEFDLTLVDPSSNQYKLAWSGGSAPIFRTDRLLALNSTSEITVTQNGSVTTYTSTSGTLMTTTDVQVGDILKIDDQSGLSISNRGTFVVLSKTATSLSVQNTNGVAEVGTVLDVNGFIAFSNGSGNQIMVGDKIRINAGFSPASYGTYEVTDVAPTWLTFLADPALGLPQESGIIPGVNGIAVYGNSKSFVMVATQRPVIVRCNGSTADSEIVSPAEIDNPDRPGLFLKTGTTYSLEIKNTGISSVSIVVTTAE